MVMNSYYLPSVIKRVVFTAGPSVDKTKPRTELEIKQLYSAVYNSLLKAEEYGAESVSIPAISTAIYGYPIKDAAPLYFEAALKYFSDQPGSKIKSVRFIDNSRGTVMEIKNRFDLVFN